MKNQFFSTEAVAEGHPDKVADQIAEAILDYFVARDPYSHVACEVSVTKKFVHVFGEVKTKISFDKTCQKELTELVHSVIKDKVGYDFVTWPSLPSLEIKINLNSQSTEIDNLVGTNQNLSSGDNSVIFGFAERNEKTEHFPPMQFYANAILAQIHHQRKNAKFNKIFQFAPDGKIQIFSIAKTVEKIILCQQFRAKLTTAQKSKIKKIIFNEIIVSLAKSCGLTLSPNLQFVFIPFVNGGPSADSGLTGRKLMSDTYGAFARHGGGSFAGKDITKPDKTLALFARFVAKNIVLANLAKDLELQVSAHIGQKTNFSFQYFSSNKLTQSQEEKIKSLLDFFSHWTFFQIIDHLNLRKIRFQKYSHYGYFGRQEKEALWEQKVQVLKSINKHG